MFFASSYAGEIDVARQALRDGLWEVARTHARKAEGNLAKVVVLESYAREGKWADVLSTVNAYGQVEALEFLYYKAAALYHTGSVDAARRLLESADFSRSVFATDASLLHASVLRREGYVDAALAKLETAGDDADSKLLAAAIHKAKDENAEAVRLWREVVAMTNASERSMSIAAANLSDQETLRVLASTSSDPDIVRFAGLRLGVLLVRGKETFAEGARQIRRIVRDSADFPGAKAAFLTLADAELSRGDFAAAVADYREATETWPTTGKDASVHLGIGMSLVELARYEEALSEFAAVRTLNAEDEVMACSLVLSGNALVKLGKLNEATACYREAIAKYPDTTEAHKAKVAVELRDLEQKGRDEVKAYRFESARNIFAEVAKRDSSLEPRMRYCDMVCLYGLGNDTAAERLASELAATSEDPSVRTDSLLWLAKFLYNRGRYREAESNFLACAAAVADPVSAESALFWATRASFAAGQFTKTVQNATRLATACPGTRSAVEGMLLQAESLIELARFDESVLVAECVMMAEVSDAALRLQAQLLRADALFAMGADNPVRYREALEAYTALRSSEKLSPSVQIRLSYKLAKTLERMKRVDEAIDAYYTRVILAFRDGRAAGIRYDEEAVAAFSRAAFRLADEHESRGSDGQAVNILRLVETAAVPASGEAGKRIERIHRKGKIL